MKSEFFDLIEEFIGERGWPAYMTNPEDGYVLHHNEDVGAAYGIFHADWDLPGGEEVRLDDMGKDYTDCVIVRRNLADLDENETIEVLEDFFFEVDDFLASL